MIYRFGHDKYNDFSVFEENKLAPRAYFIPFRSKKECDNVKYYEERYKSGMVRCLSGEWDFLYYKQVDDVPLAIDSYFQKFDKIAVPGCWQFEGYEKPYYVNVRYQFDPRPPYVPASKGVVGKREKLGRGGKSAPKGTVEVYNSVGVYRKKFHIKHATKHVLTFLGASSCIQLYVNGRYVGYSEGSHNTAEFDITGYIFDGENEMVVMVYKWCTGTYLEAQDMFRNNGIFRDVYLTDYDDSYVWDFGWKAVCNDKDYRIYLHTDAVLAEGAELTASLYYKDELVYTGKAGGDTVIDVPSAAQWTAETPELYMLYLTIVRDGKEVFCARQEIGLRNIGIKGNVLYYNNAAIKLKGVNHHDTDPDRGWCMTAEQILRDVKLMKDFNCNCVRTSHYPPDPVLLKAANYTGLYVVDEADIETHGFGASAPFYDVSRLSRDPRWKNRYWDRVYRMYMRDRNNPCIIMWSLGNESGGYRCQDYCYTNLKSLDTVTPIHYEGVCHTRRWCYDVVSLMYPSTENCEKYAEGKMPAKYYRAPFFLCEYAHAMGVGAGSLDKYVELFDSFDGFLGGCIWEFADHAAKDASGNYMYGGDNGEAVHDGNFCVDGLFYPDRTPHTGALSMRAAYRPVRASYISSNRYRFRSEYFFAMAEMKVEWKCLMFGEVAASGEFDLEIAPRDFTDVTLKHPLPDITNDCYMVFTYRRKIDGVEVASEQIELCKYIPTLIEVGRGDLALVEENDKTIVTSEEGGRKIRIVFDSVGGNIESYTVDGEEYLALDVENKGFNLLMYAAPIDNYMNVDWLWNARGFRDISVTCDRFNAEKKVENKVGRAEIQVVQTVNLGGKKRMRFFVNYTVWHNGYIDVTASLYSPFAYDMPRYGMSLVMPGKFGMAEYYGLGPEENYPDFKAQSVMGDYSRDVKDMYVPYIKPQDSGIRGECRRASVTDGSGRGFAFIAGDGQTFSFTAQDVDPDSLLEVTHDHEVVRTDRTYVSLLRFVRGVGSNSCGPDARREYRLYTGRKKELNFTFRLMPLFG